jgi:hypothetical protein
MAVTGDVKARVRAALAAGLPPEAQAARAKARQARQATRAARNPRQPASTPSATPTTMPKIQDLIDQMIGRLPADQQAIARQHITQFQPMFTQLQTRLDSIGNQLPFHPSLDHIHGPDGQMLPAIGQGGLAGFGSPGQANFQLPRITAPGQPPAGGSVPGLPDIESILRSRLGEIQQRQQTPRPVTPRPTTKPTPTSGGL